MTLVRKLDQKKRNNVVFHGPSFVRKLLGEIEVVVEIRQVGTTSRGAALSCLKWRLISLIKEEKTAQSSRVCFSFSGQPKSLEREQSHCFLAGYVNPSVTLFVILLLILWLPLPFFCSDPGISRYEGLRMNHLDNVETRTFGK